MDIRRATPADLDDVAPLLRTAGLPPIPDEIPLANILVALDARVIGVIALQVVARYGLARSAAVETAYQRQGVGTSLLHSLIARAHELGLRDLRHVPAAQPDRAGP
jgi:N-acetylglutamate synthase-like GNAT family acetyltransferase